ncbi:unnamed protein product, partial [Rotaria sp. Silwood2]
MTNETTQLTNRQEEEEEQQQQQQNIDRPLYSQGNHPLISNLSRIDPYENIHTSQSPVNISETDRPREVTSENSQPYRTATDSHPTTTDTPVEDRDTEKNADRIEASITNESLQNLYDDMNSMPSCSERSVISLLYYISCELTQNNPSGHVNSINKELESLKMRMNSEEKSLSNIRNSVKELSVYIQNQNWEEALKLLRKLFKEICPLNIHDLFRFIRKVDDAADGIKNKDIIFLLGNTGAGKSTTLHFLAGSKMIATRIKGLNHIMAASWKNPDLRNVTTSPSAKSETRFIIPITVDLSGVVASRSDSIIICDTPGFEDTNGPEVDIANGISIIRAIRECKSVRPVVLVSYKGIGDRFEGLKNLTHLLACLIPKIKNEIRAFSYIFTKYPENEKDTIHKSLINISETMNEQEKSDISFMNLFEDMLLKTKRQTLVLDPVKDEPKEFLYELLRSTAIEDPKEVFQFSITDKSKNIVNNQVRLYQLSILSAIQRYEYSVIK